MEIKTTIEYIDRNRMKKSTIIPVDLKNHIDDIHSELEHIHSLYDMISFSLYEDKNAWRSLGLNLFRDDILRHFYDENKIKEFNEKDTV